MSSERLRLKHLLQRWEVYHQHLSHQAQGNSDEEHFIGEQAHLEQRLGLRAAAQRVKHIEEYEACEGHCGISWSDFVV